MEKPTKKERRLYLLGAFILGFSGITIFYFLGITPIMTYFSAQSWPQTPCLITSSTVAVSKSTHTDSETHRERSEITYIPEIKYSYRFNGKDYSSENYTFMFSGFGKKEAAQAIARQYPVNSNAICRVNPENPHEAILNNQFPENAILAICISLGMLYCSWLIYKHLCSQQNDDGA